MIGLILSAIVGFGLFIIFLSIGLRGAPRQMPDSSAERAVRRMVNLDGLSFENSNILLDDTEYKTLRSNPSLHRVAKRFRKERQRLAILWVSLLLSDIKKLWRFRRFLVRQGVPARFSEEIGILNTYILSVICLNLLRIFIQVAGPFALHGVTRRCRFPVERMSHASASVLGRLPSAGWPEIERTWMKSMA